MGQGRERHCRPVARRGRPRALRPGLSDLIGELSTRSDEFRVRWAAHNVQIHTTGVKLIHHPVVGELELPFESFSLATDPGQSLLTYTPEPGSPSQGALNLLATWAATTVATERSHGGEQASALPDLASQAMGFALEPLTADS